MRNHLLLTAVLLMTMTLLATRSDAGVTYSATSGNRGASATFETLSNGLLQVTLSNTGVAAASSYSDVLTAVFFTLNGENPMFAQSAEVANLSSIRNCSTTACNAGNVAGEWGYLDQATFVTNAGPAHLLSANSFNGALTSSNRIGSTNLAGTTSIGGSDFGLVSSATLSTANTQISGMPVIRNTVVFTLDPSSSFSHSAIGTVGFIYGTQSWTMHGYQETPEPGSMLLMGIGLLGLGLWRGNRGNRHSED